MRVWRAHEHRVRHPAQCDVVGKAASAGQQPKIFLAPHRLPDTRSAYRRPHPFLPNSPLMAAPLLCLPTHHVVATWTGNWAWIKHIEEKIERISITDCEADCLRLPHQIVRQRRVIIITKQDKPIADGGYRHFWADGRNGHDLRRPHQPDRRRGMDRDGPTSDAQGGSNPRPEACRGHLHH
jgi:hypothetical protein